jgi:hypothetical protein
MSLAVRTTLTTILKTSLLSALVASSSPLRADDGAASIAAGGVVIMSREPRITMAKEVLRISSSKVVVDYDFRNDSDDDITIEVAFPIPDYDLSMDEADPSRQGFTDFWLRVDGQPTKYSVESRAYLKGRDCTRLLDEMHVDVASFGHATSNGDSPDIQRLSAVQRKELERLGLIDHDFVGANWKVRKKYYWRQTFPAHKIVHISHAYSPFLGGTNSIRYALGPAPDHESVEELASVCVDGHLHAALEQVSASDEKDAPYNWVDFILTSANTWKTPIEDFTLIVERPHPRDSLASYVSFCWDGPVTKVDADHFSAHASNFIPKKELRIGFFDVTRR